jgi:HTH-type transcriptional regulator / antitoxin HipB
MRITAEENAMSKHQHSGNDSDHDSYEQVAAARRSTADYREGYEEARRAFLIGQVVRERRLALGLSQTEVAARAGMTQPALSKLEAGGAVPTIPVLERIALALDTELVVTFRTAHAHRRVVRACSRSHAVGVRTGRDACWVVRTWLRQGVTSFGQLHERPTCPSVLATSRRRRSDRPRRPLGCGVFSGLGPPRGRNPGRAFQAFFRPLMAFARAS